MHVLACGLETRSQPRGPARAGTTTLKNPLLMEPHTRPTSRRGTSQPVGAGGARLEDYELPGLFTGTRGRGANTWQTRLGIRLQHARELPRWPKRRVMFAPALNQWPFSITLSEGIPRQTGNDSLGLITASSTKATAARYWKKSVTSDTQRIQMASARATCGQPSFHRTPWMYRFRTATEHPKPKVLGQARLQSSPPVLKVRGIHCDGIWPRQRASFTGTR